MQATTSTTTKGSSAAPVTAEPAKKDRRALGAMGFDAASQALEPDGPIDRSNLEQASGGGQYRNISQVSHNLYSRDGVQVNDVTKQGLEDCFLLASIAAIARTHPDRIRKMITPGPRGGYYVEVGTRKVLVSELLTRATAAKDQVAQATANVQRAKTPAEKQRAEAGLKLAQKNLLKSGAYSGGGVEFSDLENGRPEIWVAIIEQAYLQTNGGQTGGDPKNALEALAGGGRSSQVFWTNREKCVPKLLQLLAAKEPCVISTRGGKGLTGHGIALGHAVAAVAANANGAYYHETTGDNAGNTMLLPWKAFSDGTVERVTINATAQVMQQALAQARK